MRKYLIYALVDPVSSKIRYIGKTTNGIGRAKVHGQPAALSKNINAHKCNWIRSLKQRGLEYNIEVLESANSANELPDLERKWIAKARSDGAPLLNYTDGGEGTPGRVWTLESRMKLSKSKKESKPILNSIEKIVLSIAHGGLPFADQRGQVYLSIQDAAKSTGCLASQICRNLKGKIRKTAGYRFSYLDEWGRLGIDMGGADKVASRG